MTDKVQKHSNINCKYQQKYKDHYIKTTRKRSLIKQKFVYVFHNKGRPKKIFTKFLND